MKKNLLNHIILIKDKLFNAREHNKIRSRVLKNCENNAYPFAQIYFDSISADSTGTISAKVYLDYGPEITIDSLQIIGKSANGVEQKTKISRKFLANYLDLKKGDPYNEEQILKINKKSKDKSNNKSKENPNKKSKKKNNKKSKQKINKKSSKK
jgi:outer membrane translocation and assembly module TamA